MKLCRRKRFADLLVVLSLVLSVFEEMPMNHCVYEVQATTQTEPSVENSATLNSDVDIVASNNIHGQSYMFFGTPSGNYANAVYSYLVDNKDGTVSRVEAIEDSIVVEQYTKTGFDIISSLTLPLELTRFCGFFAGRDYNYIVFAQANPNEDDTKEVMRIVQYSKDWTRLRGTGLFGANTVSFCKEGSLRMCECDNMLYIRSCHEMYQTEDGLNHQANMTLCYDQSSGVITDSNGAEICSTINGYVSHSFNQFIQADGNEIVTVDHGDAYPRAIVMMKYPESAGEKVLSQIVESLEILSIPEEKGLNYTGAQVGGLEASSSHYLAAYSSVDPEYFYAPVQNVFVGTVKKDDFSESSLVTKSFTSFQPTDDQSASNPVLVKVSQDKFLLMWELYDKHSLNILQKDPGTHTIQYVFIDGEGNPLGSVQTQKGDLSDCHPLYSDGKITWYVTEGGKPRFYSIDVATEEISVVEKETVPQETASPTPTPFVSPLPTPASQETKVTKTYISSLIQNNSSLQRPKIAKVYGVSAKNIRGRGIQCKWGKTGAAFGYQLQVATNRSFTKGRRTRDYLSSRSLKTCQLKKNRTYYVRVRGYNYWNGGRIFGQWSSVKKVKIRK